MKKFLVVWAIVLMFLFPVSYVQAEDSRFKATLDFGYFSHYIGGVNGMTLYDHSVFQQSLTLSDTLSGLYIKLWSSYSPKGGFNSDFGDEIDYIIGIYRTFYDGKLGIDMGYAFYNLYDVKNTEGDLHAIYLNVNLPEVYKIKPYLSVEADIPEDKEIMEGGLIYQAGAKYDLNLPESLKGQKLNLNLSFGGHDGAYGTRPEIISFARIGIATVFKVWKIDIIPVINFQKRLGYKVEEGGMAEDKVWYGINFSVPLL